MLDRYSRCRWDSSRAEERQVRPGARSSELSDIQVLCSSRGYSRCRGDSSRDDGHQVLSGARSLRMGTVQVLGRSIECCRCMTCQVVEVLRVQRESTLQAMVSLGGELLLGLAMMVEQRWGRASRYRGGMVQ